MSLSYICQISAIIGRFIRISSLKSIKSPVTPPSLVPRCCDHEGIILAACYSSALTADCLWKWRGSGRISKPDASECRSVNRRSIGGGQRTGASGCYNWRPIWQRPKTLSHISLASSSTSGKYHSLGPGCLSGRIFRKWFY